MKSKMIQIGSDSGEYVSARHVQAITIITPDSSTDERLVVIHISNRAADLRVYCKGLANAKQVSASLAQLIEAACEA